MNAPVPHLLTYTGTKKSPQRVASCTLMPDPLKSVSAKCQIKGEQVYPQDKKKMQKGFHFHSSVAEIFHFSSHLGDTLVLLLCFMLSFHEALYLWCSWIKYIWIETLIGHILLWLWFKCHNQSHPQRGILGVLFHRHHWVLGPKLTKKIGVREVVKFFFADFVL